VIPTSADPTTPAPAPRSSTDPAPDALVDTSVAVALSVADHDGLAACRAAVDGYRIGLAGHAAFETFSVLTRLPGPARRTTTAVGRLLSTNFRHTRFLSPAAATQLLARLTETGIVGGAVYDALVGATAVEHRLPLFTRDRRALGTYQALGVDLRLIT
jgi:predicted nucleic acid-binding protein